MTAACVVRKNEYYDSIFLMRVARALAAEAGVRDCAVVMGTDANKQLLAEIGFQGPELVAATPNDLVVALVADDAAVTERLLREMDQRLTSIFAQGKASAYGSIEAAASAFPQANLVVISVPGAYAGREARKALELGKHVFVFSDNVPLEQEIELKRQAARLGLLVMGPDCGTSILAGVGIGFANRVRRGAVGVVGASGTGIQEFTSLLHQAGGGISHAIGTGSHDLADAVSGITTRMGLDALEADAQTEIIVLISKPAGMQTLGLLQERVRRCRKPVIGCLLGLEGALDCGPHFHQVRTIDAAVEQTLSLGNGRNAGDLFQPSPARADQIEKEVRGWLPGQRYLRGLFAGGTFCFQAQQVLREGGIPVYSNTPLDGRYRLANPEASLEHTLIDLGDDHFTHGKPHPMIDAGERRKRILREANDAEVAILLLDFVLGDMASPDPVGDLLPAIRKAQEIVAQRGARLTVVASVCGTDLDTQNLERQKSLLAAAEVHVLPSSAMAAGFCLELLRSAGGRSDG